MLNKPNVSEWLIKDRNIAKPTGLYFGTVINVSGSSVHLACNPEWVNSETFLRDSRAVNVADSREAIQNLGPGSELHIVNSVEEYDARLKKHQNL